jgi:hypothetical protein
VEAGVLGEVREVVSWTNRPSVPMWREPVGSYKQPDHSKFIPVVPKTLNWDAWLGASAARPYDPAYLPGLKWRGWWDFGTGALGDMACHIMNSAFWALNLTNPASVEAISHGKTDVQAPHWSVIKYEFPQLGKRKPLTAFWYDGKMMPPVNLMNGKPFPGGGGNGTVFVGEKGSIAAGYLDEPFLVDDQQQKDIKAPEKFMPRSIGHHAEWLESILGGPDAASAIGHAGPLTEMVLLGNLAVRTGERIEWDHEKLKVKNSRDAQKHVKREYRKGWEL